jgi:hypothetical protein
MLDVSRLKMCGERKTIGPCPDDCDGHLHEPLFVTASGIEEETRGVELINLGKDLRPR